MKLKIGFFAFALGTGLACAQGTFVFDQQETGTVDGSIGLNRTPLGQSFTPTFDSIGFVEFQLINGVAGSTFTVNVRGGSISGSVLGTTDPVAYNSSGIYDFFFSTPVSLTSGTQYYLEPVVSSGGFATMPITFIQYTGGDAIYDGTTHTDRDFWFREGIVTNVPEPSSAALFLVAGAALFLRRLKCRPINT
jgi:hypothetical protein